MTSQFGLFAKDGLKIKGTLTDEQFPVLAKNIANNYISLYFHFKSTSVLLGSCFTLKPTSGGREEGFVIIGEFTPDEIKKTEIRQFLQKFFSDALELISQSGYTFIDIYGEQRIKEKTFLIPENQTIKPFTTLVCGKILFSKPGFVYSKDFISSLSFLSEVLKNLSPVLHLEYKFVISLLSVPADLLICSNKPTDVSKIDIDLEEKISRIPFDENEHYQILGEYLSKLKSFPPATQKNQIAFKIANSLALNEKDPERKEDIATDWILFLYEKHPDGKKSIQFKVNEVINHLISGKRKYFQIYVNSEQYDKTNLELALRQPYHTLDELRQIETNAQLISQYPSPEMREEILTLIKKIISEKKVVVPTTITPKLKLPSEQLEFDIPRPRNSNKYQKIAIIAGILILLAVIGFVVVNPLHIAAFNFFGILQAPGSDDSRIPATDICSRDFNTPDCELPRCCVVKTQDNLGIIKVPTDGFSNNTKISLTTESASEYKVPYQIQDTKYRLQSDTVYYVNIENLEKTGEKPPILKITVRDFDNFKKGFIAKLDEQTKTWQNITATNLIPRDYYQVTLGNSPNGYYGLFIEEQEIH